MKYDPSNISKIDAYQFDTKNDGLNFELINEKKTMVTIKKKLKKRLQYLQFQIMRLLIRTKDISCESTYK